MKLFNKKLKINLEHGINLDTFEILGIKVGSRTQLNEGSHRIGCVYIHVKNSIIEFISVRLGEFYTSGKTFLGQMEFNGNIIEINNKLQPKIILEIFDDPIDHWDDDVEVNYQFKVKNIEIEFSWHWRSKELLPNHIGFEIEQHNPKKPIACNK